MAPTKKIEIFGDKEKELKSKFEAEGYDWKEIRKELKELSEKEKKEDIDRKLSELQGNVDEQFIYLKGLLEKYRIDLKKKGGDGLVDKAKDKVKEKIEEEKLKLTDSFKKSVKEIPLIGGFLVKAFDWVQENTKENPDDGFMTKTKKGFFGWLGGSILLLAGGFIGYNKFKDDIKSISSKVGGEVTEGIDSIVGKVKEVGEKISGGTEQVGGSVATAQEKVENLITPEKRRNAYSKGGLFLIKSLSGINFEKSDTSARSIYDKLKDISLKDIKKSYSKYYESNDYKTLLSELGLSNIVNESDEPGVKKAILSIISDNSINIISSRLKNFKELLNDKDVKDKFGTEFIDNITKKTSYEELTLDEISFLFALSTPSFVKELGVGISSTIGGLYGDLSSEIGELKKEFEEKREMDISTKLFSNMLSKGFGTKGLITGKEEEVISEFGNGLREDEKAQLIKIIKFKDLIINRIKNDYKLNFGMTDFSTKFEKNLTYSSIVELYLLLNGDIKKLDSIDLVQKMGVLFIIRDSFKDDKLKGEYEGFILTEIKKTIDKKASEILTIEESLFLQTHIQKFTKNIFDDYIKIITEFREGMKPVVKSELENVLGTEIPKEANNYGEYLALASAAGVLWKIKRFTPAGFIWTGIIGIGTWGASILSETQLYKDWIQKKIQFSPEVEKVLEEIKKASVN
ncbi:hypothetical protein EOM39_03635 [Candidatus Gracilibacteria bacterium]|nr:hypothetical protein [Candidatus Gracilibacteria bacterium]